MGEGLCGWRQPGVFPEAEAGSLLNILATFTGSPGLAGPGGGQAINSDGFHTSCLQAQPLPRKRKAKQIYVPGQASRREVSSAVRSLLITESITQVIARELRGGQGGRLLATRGRAQPEAGWGITLTQAWGGRAEAGPRLQSEQRAWAEREAAG